MAFIVIDSSIQYLSCLSDKIRNGATYGSEILHENHCCASVTHGLGLMSIGVIIGKKTVHLKQCFSSSSKPKIALRLSVAVD